MTPEDRIPRARIAAHTQQSLHDVHKTTAAGRQAFLDRFDRQVDPDGVLPPAERARRAEHAKRAYFLKLAAASAKARRRGAA